MTGPRRVERIAMSVVPTEWGPFRAVAYRGEAGAEHLALVVGDVADGRPVLARVHSECLTGDVFGSSRCDCGAQLQAALGAVQGEQRGVVLYLRGHEGRGIGLAAKIQAYALQDAGLDTYDANLELGFPVDAREFGDAAAILRDLGAHQVLLITNNPSKCAALEEHGVRVVEQLPSQTEPTHENRRYLETKRDRMGHRLEV